MAITRIALGALALSLMTSSMCLAQSTTVEADVSAGRSTEGVSAAATQVRFFGATASDLRYFVELAVGSTWGADSDVFAAAYPYDRRARAIEAYVDKTFHAGGTMFDVRGGRYRTPFGISSRSDQAYTGFVRPPLIRYGDNFALSNTFFETGGDLLVGTPAFQVETSLGTATDAGEGDRSQGLDAVVRAQGYYRSFIVGASYMRAKPDDDLPFSPIGMLRFGGVDARWTCGGLQLRGEWISGHPFDLGSTTGGYLDAIVHQRGMGPVTAIARIERLDFVSALLSQHDRRVTAGARVRILNELAGTIGVVHQPNGLAGGRGTALDLGVTFTIRR